MNLLIVESPAKAKTIEKYLKDIDPKGDFTVRASVGHVRDLPKSNKKAIDIKAGFVPHYEVTPAKRHVVEELAQLTRKAKRVVLATDPDREGEAIAWHIADELKLKKPERITFNEITKEAVAEALANPRAIDTRLRLAQEARRVLDRLVGYDLSGLIWKKVRYGLSAGRVQSPALRIIMEREREIRAFIPEDYWVLTAKVERKNAPKGDPFTLTCEEEPRDLRIVEDIIKKGTRGTWLVTNLKETEVTRRPNAPFTTSTLQQTASSRLGFAPSRTMMVAQKLYEAGHITYMRTDSTNVSETAHAEIQEVISKQYKKELYKRTDYKTKSKNAQEAHEAIRPSHPHILKAGATDEQKKLYALIWSRTVASQMTEATMLRTKLSSNIEGGGIPDFSINGSRVKTPGWLIADPLARQEDTEVPKLSVGDALHLLDLTNTPKQTQPPARYSEAALVKELEKRGIGRPSTYASIIRTIETRGYVEKRDRSLMPTDTGDVVSSFLEENFPTYISDTFTAEMEDKLDDIANGEREYVKTLKDFYTPFLKEVKEKDAAVGKITNLGSAPEEYTCPACGANMVYKLSRNGRFMSCSRFPECTGARKEDGSVMEPPKDLGKSCPLCGEAHQGTLVEREGKYGLFVACSRYPKCKYVEKSENDQSSTGVTCATCKQGEMIERRGRFGPFFSCSRYPDCKSAIKTRPTGNLCHMCESLMMEGTKTIPERCSNKQCLNHNPHKLAK